MPCTDDNDGRDDWDGQDYTDWIDELNGADYWYGEEAYDPVEYDPNDDPMCGFDEGDADDE